MLQKFLADAILVVKGSGTDDWYQFTSLALKSYVQMSDLNASLPRGMIYEVDLI
jgi:hypothetical protein